MRDRRISFMTFVAGAVIAGLFSTAVPGWSNELRVGDEAPDFVLPGSDGSTHRLGDFRGEKVVVLAWFPKAFTGG